MKMNKENEKKFDLPARKPISISFDDRTEYFEPENFKPDVATNKRRAMINDQIDSSTKFNTTNNANNPMKIRMRSRYSTFISGISQFDPYQELTATQIAAFRQVFDTVDRDGGGSIDAEELFHSMRDVEPSLKLEEIKEILEELDQDGNGTIDFEEFLYMMTSMSMQIKEASQHEDIITKSSGRKRQSIFFSVITKFAMKHSLKEIERYYASKSHHTPHVVAHYAAGACVEGLTEKELRQTWRHLFLANKGKDSPYAQPLNFVMATVTRNKKNSNRKINQKSPELLTPSPIFYSQHSRNSSPSSLKSMSRCSSRSKSPRSPRPESQCGWTPRHGLPITKVALPMVIYTRNKNRNKLTIIDMDKIRERVTVARNCYYNQLNLENEEKATKYWETLKIEEIPSQRLQRNFLKVFRAYSPTNEYENHIINESKNKSQKGKSKQEEIKRNSRSPVLLRL